MRYRKLFNTIKRHWYTTSSTQTRTTIWGSPMAKQVPLCPRFITFFLTCCSFLFSLGEYDKAVVSYELAVHFNPACCEAYNNLGVIYKDRDNLERSIQCYSSALNVNPKFSQTLNNLGVVYTIQGKVTYLLLCPIGCSLLMLR